MRKLVFDADDLSRMLLHDEDALRDKLAAYRNEGFEILLSVPARLPAKNAKALNESLDDLNALVGLCDAIVFGGPDKRIRGLHLDDKAVSSDEFLKMPFEELSALVEQS